MAVVFQPVVAPIFPLSDDRAPKMKVVGYGDGYTGRMPDGINNDLEKQILKWEGLTREEYKPLKAFFEQFAGTGQPFLYTVPWTNDADDVQKLYYCPSWSRGRPKAGEWTIQANIQEVREAA